MGLGLPGPYPRPRPSPWARPHPPWGTGLGDTSLICVHRSQRGSTRNRPRQTGPGRGPRGSGAHDPDPASRRPRGSARRRQARCWVVGRLTGPMQPASQGASPSPALPPGLARQVSPKSHSPKAPDQERLRGSGNQLPTAVKCSPLLPHQKGPGESSTPKFIKILVVMETRSTWLSVGLQPPPGDPYLPSSRAWTLTVLRESWGGDGQCEGAL